MQHALRVLCLGLLVVASGCGGQASGGGWLPSADQVDGHKATFGFEYKCDDTTHTLKGTISYHDHGTGHRLAAKLNELLVDPDGNPFGCGVELPPGISSACGVVKSGGGGVLPGDVVIVATQDGKVFTGSDSDDAIVIGLR